MKEFIDETSEKMGTEINRETLMAMQGFIGNNIVFNSNGSITETNSKNEKLTTTFSGNVITEKFEGEKTITKKTTFLANGNITEEIS